MQVPASQLRIVLRVQYLREHWIKISGQVEFEVEFDADLVPWTVRSVHHDYFEIL